MLIFVLWLQYIVLFFSLLATITAFSLAISNVNPKVADIESNISSNYNIHILTNEINEIKMELNVQNLTIMTLFNYDHNLPLLFPANSTLAIYTACLSKLS